MTTNTVKHTPPTDDLIAEVKAKQKKVRDGIEDLKYRLPYMDGYEAGVRSTLHPAPQEKVAVGPCFLNDADGS